MKLALARALLFFASFGLLLLGAEFSLRLVRGGSDGSPGTSGRRYFNPY